MSLTDRLATVVTDRSALLGSSAAAIAGLPPLLIVCYVSVRLILPVVLIFYAANGATSVQRINLVGAYLLHQPNPPADPKDKKRKTRRPRRR